jgi:hypothetical protein
MNSGFEIAYNTQHATLLSLFSKVNREKVRPSLDKKLLEVEEAIDKIEQIKNKITSKTDKPDERSGNGTTDNNK